VPTNYILVDYENVQPNDVDLLTAGTLTARTPAAPKAAPAPPTLKVKVFLGPAQSKVPVSLAQALQPLGPNAEYIQLQTSGSNALDFHIAYYIGALSHADPSAHFHIISKDAGFDPLIKHLRAKNLIIQRSAHIAEIPYLKPSLPTAEDAQIEAVVKDLIRRKAAKPRTEKTLKGTLHALFNKELTEQQLTQLYAALRKRGYVKVEGTKVSYELPAA